EDLGTDDDGVPTEEVSPELMEEISGEIDEAQLLSLPTPKKPTRVFQSCQRDPKAPPMTLLNQDLFYLKHGNSGPKKYILSLHKYPAVPFPEDDIEERTSRWAKQDHIRRQKEQRDKPEEVYSKSKIVEVIRTSYELGHEHKFITKIVRNWVDCPSLSEALSSRKEFMISNSSWRAISRKSTSLLQQSHSLQKGEEVMILKEIPKFCDATVKRVLEKLKKYNKDVKYGYVDPSPSDANVEYLQFYEEDIEDQLKHRDQMKRCKMYVNGRPL
ncbi:hypothetical protein Tco_0983497, partial [Tanacetum coccineum]